MLNGEEAGRGSRRSGLSSLLSPSRLHGFNNPGVFLTGQSQLAQVRLALRAKDRTAWALASLVVALDTAFSHALSIFTITIINS